MAKSMARIKDGVVVNIEWHSSDTVDSDTLKEFPDLLVGIGDTYAEGRFYREGVMLLTPLEEASEENTELKAALKTLGVSM